MGWLRLDDGFTDHPKVAGLSALAFRAHVEGLVYCARYLTDGLVPKAKGPSSARVIAELERAGLWTATRGGYRIHDYLDWNPSRADADAKRAAKSMAGAKGAASRWQGQSHSRGNAPVPVPVPVPKEQILAPAKRARPRDELFEALAEVSNANIAQLTRSARGQLNDATKQLREIGATPDDVRGRAAAYRRVHPTWDFTVSALVKHWPNLNGTAPPDRIAGGRAVEDMSDAELEELMGRG